MDLNDKIRQRLDELLAEGDGISETVEESHVDASRLAAWRASCMSLLDQLPSQAKHYRDQFALRTSSEFYRLFADAQSILHRVRDDFANGWLGDLREVAASEVFGDLLQMAEYLYSNVSHIPAASLAGAVLEDCLRRLHLKHVGKWPGKNSSIAKLNTGLYSAKFYSNTQQQHVMAWAAIRNDADHGYTDKVDKGDVKRMLDGIREFIVKYEG